MLFLGSEMGTMEMGGKATRSGTGRLTGKGKVSGVRCRRAIRSEGSHLKS